eukprot:403366046
MELSTQEYQKLSSECEKKFASKKKYKNLLGNVHQMQRVFNRQIQLSIEFQVQRKQFDVIIQDTERKIGFLEDLFDKTKSQQFQKNIDVQMDQTTLSQSFMNQQQNQSNLYNDGTQNQSNLNMQTSNFQQATIIESSKQAQIEQLQYNDNNGQNITLSEETKTFDDVNSNSKDSVSNDNIIIINDYFLSDVEKAANSLFKEDQIEHIQIKPSIYDESYHLKFNLQAAIRKREYKINQNQFQQPQGFKIPTSIVMSKFGYLIEGGLDERIIIRQKIGKIYTSIKHIEVSSMIISMTIHNDKMFCSLSNQEMLVFEIKQPFDLIKTIQTSATVKKYLPFQQENQERQMRHRVDIFDICKTQFQQYEYAVAQGQYGGGLFFIRLFQEESLEETIEGQFQMTLDYEEIYFKNQAVSCVLERKVINYIENPSQDLNYNCLQQFLGHNQKKYPYLLLKDETMVTLLNTKTFTETGGDQFTIISMEHFNGDKSIKEAIFQLPIENCYSDDNIANSNLLGVSSGLGNKSHSQNSTAPIQIVNQID